MVAVLTLPRSCARLRALSAGSRPVSWRRAAAGGWRARPRLGRMLEGERVRRLGDERTSVALRVAASERRWLASDFVLREVLFCAKFVK